ncbi:hypothetical protein EMIT0180MI3_30688 [Priestia megaterium]
MKIENPTWLIDYAGFSMSFKNDTSKGKRPVSSLRQV